MTTNARLKTAIKGLYSDFLATDTPSVLRAAPLQRSTSKGEFLRVKEFAANDVRTPSFRKVSYGTPAAPGQVELETIQVALDRYVGDEYFVPARLQKELEETGGFDWLQELIAQEITRSHDHYASLFASAVSGLDAATGNLTASTASFDFQSWLLSNVEKVHLAGRKRPNTLVVSQKTAHDLIKLDQLQSGTAIASLAGGETLRRAGSVDPSALAAFVKAQAGLDLVVDDRIFINSSGVSGYCMTGKAALLHAGPGVAPSALKTFVKTNSDGIAPEGSIYTINGPYETNNPKGMGFYVDTEIEVKVLDARLGVVATVN